MGDGLKRGWLVNDYKSTLPGANTLWENLLEWIPGLDWVGDIEFEHLASHVDAKYKNTPQSLRPEYIIRNGTYFRKLDIDIPTYPLIQDVAPKSGGSLELNIFRRYQLDVCLSAERIVYNSLFTKSHYPELCTSRSAIIPLGVDFDTFRPMNNREELRRKWGIPDGAVCWVGMAEFVKGWSYLCRIADMSERPFVIISKKDELFCGDGIVSFSRVPHRDLAEIYNACDIGLCTSVMETQHLAGIEMGACGLPMLTTNVGVYYNKPPGLWGSVFIDVEDAVDKMKSMGYGGQDVSSEWADFSLDKCKSRWRGMIGVDTA